MFHLSLNDGKFLSRTNDGYEHWIFNNQDLMLNPVTRIVLFTKEYTARATLIRRLEAGFIRHAKRPSLHRYLQNCKLAERIGKYTSVGASRGKYICASLLDQMGRQSRKYGGSREATVTVDVFYGDATFILSGTESAVDRSVQQLIYNRTLTAKVS